MNFDVRRLKRSDIEVFSEDLRSMWLQHSKEHSNLISSDFLKKVDTEEYLEASLENKNEFVLIALFKGKPVGMMKVEEQVLEDFFHYDKCFFLDDVIVLPDFRREGIAKILMQEVKDIAKKREVQVLKGRVYRFNKPAIKYLKSESFQEIYSEYFHLPNL
jgi:GNAT superfamily N-acetyltransferase